MENHMSYVKFCFIMHHKNLTELEFLYRFLLQEPCCDSCHPEASVMSAEHATIFTSQVLFKIGQ